MGDEKLNEDLLIEEYDREVVSPYFGEVNKVRVGKKVVSFDSVLGDSIKFERCKSGLGITAMKIVNEYKKCDLGHMHQVVKCKQEHMFFQIDFEMLQVLIEWAEQGPWKATPRLKKKKESGKIQYV